MHILERNGEFLIVSRKGKTISEFETLEEATETLYQWMEDQADAQEGFNAPEDTPCLDLMQFHGPWHG